MCLSGVGGCDWYCALEFMGVHWGINNYRLFNYLSDFAENRLKGVYMYQDDTCEIIALSNYSFNNYDQKPNCTIRIWLSLDEAY